MTIKWAKWSGLQITMIFKFLSFTAAFTQSKFHLSDEIDRECAFHNQTSNSFTISAQSFLRMNTDSWVNSVILILLTLNNWISYKWLFQDLQTKYVSLSDGIWRTEKMHMNTQLSLIDLNSAFYSKYIIQAVLKKCLIH